MTGADGGPSAYSAGTDSAIATYVAANAATLKDCLLIPSNPPTMITVSAGVPAGSSSGLTTEMPLEYSVAANYLLPPPGSGSSWSFADGVTSLSNSCGVTVACRTA